MLFPPSVKFRVKFISLELLYKIVKQCWWFKALSIKVDAAAVDIAMQMSSLEEDLFKLINNFSYVT